MARPKKEDVIAELKAMDVDIRTDDYNELCGVLNAEKARRALLDEAEEQVISPQEVKVRALKLEYGEELYAYARKIGLIDEQIASYTDRNTLYMACQNIKPQATALAEPVKRPAPVRSIRGVPADIEFICTLDESRARNINRVNYDDMQMNSFLRKQRIEIRGIQRVMIDRDYKPDRRGILTTVMVISYLKKD